MPRRVRVSCRDQKTKKPVSWVYTTRFKTCVCDKFTFESHGFGVALIDGFLGGGGFMCGLPNIIYVMCAFCLFSKEPNAYSAVQTILLVAKLLYNNRCSFFCHSVRDCSEEFQGKRDFLGSYSLLVKIHLPNVGHHFVFSYSIATYGCSCPCYS